MKRVLRRLLLGLLGLAARPFVRPASGAPTRIVYIKPDHLGDLLLATPALAALRACFPNAQIAALVGPWAALVLARNPDLDALLTCPFPGFERMKRDTRQETGDTRLQQLSRLLSPVSRLLSLARPYVLLLRYAALLRAGRYDAALLGRDDHWWGAALALLAGIPVRVGFATAECRPLLTRALPWRPRDHVTSQGLALVGELAGRAVGSFPARFDPQPADHEWAAGWLREQGIAAERLVVIHPGTAGPDKHWLPERWAEVADGLCFDGAQMVLTGGPGEQALVAQVAGAMRAEAAQLAGATSLGQLAALLGQAQLVLGVDSGPLHLAAAQGRPTVHLYGPGDDARFGPWGSRARHVVVREELWCSPCGVFSACPRGLALPECMGRIAVARVLAEARGSLSIVRSA